MFNEVKKEEPIIKELAIFGVCQIWSFRPATVNCLIQTRQSNNFCRPTSSNRTYNQWRIDNV
jgi:hypothetical protein